MNDQILENDPLFRALRAALTEAIESEPLALEPPERFKRGLTRWHESLIGLAFLAANRAAAEMVIENTPGGTA
tara:strand:- start:2984 stop:3202 length:219 start_codon:yes stop_codon:yes gene_type:complete